MNKNLARNLEDQDHNDHQDEQEKDPTEKKKQQYTANFNQGKLSVQELQDLKDKKTTIDDIVAERMEVERVAEAELKNLLARNKKGEEILTVKEYQDYQNRIHETESPDKLEDIVKELKKLPEEKAKEKKDAAYEAKERDPEDPELLKIEDKFIKTCKLNRALIGENQMKGFESWIKGERKEKPSIKHLKDCLRRLEGTEVFDKDGLAPRRAEYGKIQELFEKYGLNSPLESSFIRAEGLKERTHFRKNAESLENHLRVRKDTGLYSPKVMKDMMQDILLANHPGDQEKMLVEADNIARKESEGLTHLDATMTVKGMTIRCMSDKSQDELKAFYKDLPLGKRMENVSQWKKFVKAEGDLVFKLEEIYGDDTKGFKLALAGFEDKNWPEKEKEIDKHEKLVDAAESKEEMHKTLIIKAAHGKIDEAARKKILAPGNDNTQGKYKEFFENEDNFKNADTKKTGDIGELEKAFKLLISTTPNDKYKNLASYENRRNKFGKDLKELGDISGLTKEEIAEWEEEYDEEGWTQREKLHNELKAEIAKEKEERKAQKALEEEVDLTNEDKEEAELNKPKLDETITRVTELLAEEKGAEAMKALLLYNETDPDNAKVLFWIKVVGEFMKEFGSGKKMEATVEKEIEKEIEELAHDEFKDQLKEEQGIRLSIEGADLSEKRHQYKKSAKDRALQDSLDQTDEGSLEEELVEDFYKNTDGFILDEEGTGDELMEHKMDDISLNREEQNTMRKDVYENQSDLTTKEGFAYMNFVDASNHAISAEQAANVQKEDLAEIEDEMVDRAEEKVHAKMGLGASKNNVVDLQSRVAARRKAKSEIEEHTTERLRSAA